MAEFFAHVELLRRDEPTVTPEQILSEAGISTKRQALSAADVEPAGGEGVMAEQPKDPMYDTGLELAKVHLIAAFDSFKTDARIPWRQIRGNVPKVQHQVWVDALKETLKHHQQIEGLLS